VRSVLFWRAQSHVVAERAATLVVSEPHPQENLAVASVKHCSILALIVLFFRPLREDQPMQIEKRSEERDVCYGG
jgi:hypothetical protein